MSSRESAKYGKILNQSMLNVVKWAIEKISKKEDLYMNEIYITFSTQHPDAEISSRIKGMYKEKLSILIQNNFQELRVEENHFVITLSLVTGLETLKIPYTSIMQFLDQTEKFALKFILETDIKQEEVSTSSEKAAEKAAEKFPEKSSDGSDDNVIKVDFKND